MSESHDSQSPRPDPAGPDRSASSDGPDPERVDPGIRYGLDDEPGPVPPPPGPTPPPGAFPPPGITPPPGFVPPPGGYTLGGPPPGAGDPLVGVPGGGFDDWARRTVAICRRSGGPALAILAITGILPVLLTGVVYALMSGRLNAAMPVETQRVSTAELMDLYRALGQYFAVALPAMLLVGYLSSIGWCATLRVMAQDAVGQPRDIAAALRYGVRRGLALWGWYVLAMLCCLVGLCACVVPVIYLALAMSLIAPITVFERGRPAISGSFRLMHAHFWPAVGRLMVLALVVFGYLLLVQCALNLAVGGAAAAGTATQLPSTTQVVVQSLVRAVLDIPATVAGIAGILAVYAEQRGRLEPLSSADLARSAS